MLEDAYYPRFLAFWSNEGLESIIDLHFLAKTNMWDILKGKDDSPMATRVSAIMRGMMLRARFNPQRKYEMYVFNSDDEIAEQDVIDAFEASPQTMVDTIRRIGQKIYVSGSKSKSVIE